MCDSLRRWSHGRLAGGEIPAEATLTAMDAAGVRTGMLCAWWGPRGPLIANDAVAAMTRNCPGAGLELDDETTSPFLHGNAERVLGLASTR
jgi:hypothetical protein